MSGLASAKAHVKINGGEFILVEESYRKKAQQPFSPRFATGDPTEGDNSFWQFLSQKGWTGEGQEKFDVVTKYRQSAGWDMRDGRARLARTPEAVTLTGTMPAVLTSSTFTLFEDFESSVDFAARWTNGGALGGNFALTGGLRSAGSSSRGYGGMWTGTVGTAANYYPAAGAANTVTSAEGYTGYPLPKYYESSSLANVGTWQFDLYGEATGQNMVQARVFFMGSSAGGYIFQASDATLSTWKLIKTARDPRGVTPPDGVGNTTGDTVILTCAGVTGGTGTAITVKITRDSSGNFEVFENGVSKGTVTDTTYSAAGIFAYTLLMSWCNSGGPNYIGAGCLIDNVYFPSNSTSFGGFAGKFINYYNSLYTCWDSGGTSFAFTVLRTAAVASNLPRIVHQEAQDIAVWARDNSPTGNDNVYLAACYGATFRVYDYETQVYTVATTVFGNCIVPINSTTIAVIGTTGSVGSGVPAIEIMKFDAGAWTRTSAVVLEFDGNTSGRIANYATLDSNGGLFFASNDLTATLGPQPSRLFYMSSTDLLATNPTLTAQWTLSDFTCRGIFTLNGTVYLFGARHYGSNSRAAIMSTAGSVIWESSKDIALTDTAGAAANFYNHGIASIWKSLDKVLFLGMNDLGLYSPILQMDTAGNVVEIAAFESGQFSTALPNPIAVAEWNGRVYLLNGQGDTITRTALTRGAFTGTPATLVLQLSDMGGNTSLVNKTLRSVLVELSEALPATETLSVIVNGTTVGTMVTADGTRKEIQLSAELTSSKFTTKLSFPKATTWTGYIPAGGVMLKYVPTQFKKRAWAMGLRCTNSLRMIDGRKCAVNAATLLAALWTAWASNIPVVFIDLDGVSYDVLVTDIQENRPLVPEDQAKLEALAFVELLQV